MGWEVGSRRCETKVICQKLFRLERNNERMTWKFFGPQSEVDTLLPYFLIVRQSLPTAVVTNLLPS